MDEPKTPEAKSKRDRALELKAQGLTGKAIAEMLNLTPGRVSQMIGTPRKQKNNVGS